MARRIVRSPTQTGTHALVGGPARHELVLQRCTPCSAWRWPPREMCGRCGSFEYAWRPLSGRGTVVSWIVNHHTFSDAFPSPYAVVSVRLDEQPDLVLVGSWRSPTGEARIGLPAEAVFDDVATSPERVTLLSWRSRPG